MTDHQIKTEFVIESGGTHSFEPRYDVETAGCEDDGEGEPKSAVRRECSGTEGVSNGHFPARRWSALSRERLASDGGIKDVPHSSEQLDQASIAKGKADYQTRRTQSPRAHVDQAQDEGGQGESAQAQGRRVGDTTVLDLLVETGLELSSEGRQALFATGGVDMSERTIAEASGSFGGLVFLVGHFPVHAAVAIGFFVVVFGGVAGELGVGVGGHCGGEEIFKRPRGVEVEVGLVGGARGGLNRSVSRVAIGEMGYILISEGK